MKNVLNVVPKKWVETRKNKWLLEKNIEVRIVAINAILHILENGCNWRALPDRFGKWSTIYARFRGWSKEGVL